MIAQEETIITKPEKRISIFPMPVISVNPTAGLVLGMSPSLNWYSGNPETTSMSTALALAVITTNKQFFSSVRSNAFLKDDSWALYLDVRYNINNQPTFGLGSGIELITSTGSTNSGKPFAREERIFFNHFRTYGIALKRLMQTRFFYGLGYHFDAMYNITDEAMDIGTDPEELTFHHTYQQRNGIQTEEYNQSGISLNAMYDSRDNVANTYKGQFAMLSYRSFPEHLGSTSSGSQLWAEYRNYFSIDPERPRHILALWTYGWFVTGGTVPYMFLPALGWDMFNRSGRPYTFGRFRGEDLVYGELEWRFPLQRHKNRLGGVIFLNSISASNRTEAVALFDHVQLGYGLGLRFMVLPRKRLNVGLDYGWGANGASGFFINIYEVF